jgi:RNA polymerase subunit RPABC4/transcription elongation factor Spt4
MNGQSRFRSEVAIIPGVAWVVAVIVMMIVQICLLGLLPHFEKDIPPMAALIPISILGGVVLGIVVLMVGYVNADSRRRGMNPLLWTLLVIVVPKALGFIAYFLLRKPLVMACPNCRMPVSSDFRFCPNCRYAVTPTCAHCGKAVQRDWMACPYCGNPVTTQASTPATVAPPATPPVTT